MSDDPTRPDLSRDRMAQELDGARRGERAVMTETGPPEAAPPPVETPPVEVPPVVAPPIGTPPVEVPPVEPQRTRGSVGVGDAPDGSGDPQAGVQTREHSLAQLREAARLAAARMGVEVEPDEIDLVEAERRETAELAGLADGAPENGVVENVAVEDGAVEDGAAQAEGIGSESEASGSSSIDPRIRERRVAVTRAEGRRRLRILLTAVCVASAIGIVWLLVQSPILAVNSIEVRGTTQESRAAVQAAAGVHTGTALLFVDTGAVAHRVEALPWVASAHVSRDLPNTLSITVVERAPVAWARRAVPRGSPKGTLGAVVLVDRSGRVLGDAAGPPPGFPELVGMSRVPERGGRIVPAGPPAALSQLPDALRAETASITMHHGQAVLALAAVSGGAIPAADEVRLGDLDQVAAKGAAALAVLDQLGSDGEHVHYIDVRVPGAPATR